MLNQNNQITKKLIWHGCLLLLGSFGILMFLSFELGEVNLFSDVEIPVFSVFIIDKASDPLFYSIAFVVIAWVLHKLRKIAFSHISIGKFLTVLCMSVFFSVFSLLSAYFEEDLKGELSEVWNEPLSMVVFIGALIGGTLVFFVVIRCIWYLGDNFKEKVMCENKSLVRFFSEHLYRNCIIVISLCWLPQYIIRFPGVVPYDVWQSIAMHFGYTPITTQHPLIWGELVGYLTEIGAKIGVSWLAPLLICFVQHILCILIVTYTISTLKKLKFNSWFLGITLAFYIILPALSLYASTLYNDCFYCLSIMLLTIELLYYLYDRETYFCELRHLLLTALAVFGTIFRYNGYYTMLALIVVIAIREIYLLIKRNAKIMQTVIVLLLCMILPLSCGQATQNSLNEHFGAEEIRSRAMLAMPIQQSVRCLAEYGDSIPQEDYEAIHAVLTWTDEEYAEEYNPRNFDDVKESFKSDASSEEITGFLRAWVNLVFRYPTTCFMATANQTYYLFSPTVNNVRYYESISAHTGKAMERYRFDASPYVLESPILDDCCKALLAFESIIFPQIPVVGLTVNCAVYVILLFSICLSVLFKKDRRPLVLSVALLITLAITFLGPAVYKHPRYIYSIMYCMPVLIAAFMLPDSKKTSLSMEKKL